MIRFFKKILKDRRGNTLAIAAAALPLVIGSAGLATDTIQWVTWKRQLQRAADSAAFAGAYAKAAEAGVDTAVTADLANNNHTPATLLGGYPQITYPAPPASGTWSEAVRVELAVQKRLGFSSLFLSNAPIIKTSATAAFVDEGDYCVVALKKSSATPGIIIGGSSNSVMGCGAIANATGTPAVETNGNAHNFDAPVVAGAGSLPDAINGVDELDPYHAPLPDPFEDMYPTDIPASEQPCKSFNNHLRNEGSGSAKDYHLEAGCYTGFKIVGNETYTMDPGVYYLDSADFDIGGDAKLIGEGVTIILTGDDPGSIKTNGGVTIKLTAPTTGTYEKMLFIQSANAEASNESQINGNNQSSYDGAVYFPKGKVEFSGSTSAMTKCAMVVAYEVKFTGNSNIQNDTYGCKANKKVTGKVLRLVA